MENRKIRVAITHGDTNGIGYELIFRTFAEPEILELCTPIIYGSPKVAAYHRKALNMQANFTIIADAAEAQDDRINMIATFDEEVKVDMGRDTPEAGKAALAAMDRAIADFKDGHFDVLVLAPQSSDNIKPAEFQFPGNFEYVETCLGDGRKGLRMMVNDRMRMVLLTDGVPLKEVAGAVTAERLSDKLTAFHTALRRCFRVSSPRIAVLSLNPDGANGGKEEKEVIMPVIGQLADKGINVFGPYDAGTFFGQGDYEAFDGVLAMYHDQGVAPLLALSPERLVNCVAGLPVVVASADMNPHYEIAGLGKANETAFRQAIFTAIDIFRNGKDYDEPYANPLPKLYHEKRDESEKVRFSIPKKHENAIKERQQ